MLFTWIFNIILCKSTTYSRKDWVFLFIFDIFIRRVDEYQRANIYINKYLFLNSIMATELRECLWN